MKIILATSLIVLLGVGIGCGRRRSADTRGVTNAPTLRSPECEARRHRLPGCVEDGRA